MFCQYFCHWYSSERQRFSVPQQDTVVLTFSTDLLPCSANPAYHELLLTVLWYGVVHTSALVRCTAARMFEVCKQKFQIVMIFFGRGRGTIFFEGRELFTLCYIDVHSVALDSIQLCPVGWGRNLVLEYFGLFFSLIGSLNVIILSFPLLKFLLNLTYFHPM